MQHRGYVQHVDACSTVEERVLQGRESRSESDGFKPLWQRLVAQACFSAN